MKEKSCGAVIFRKERGRRKYLLLHYDSGHWDFVKGHVEKGESEEETARREAEEETGIQQLQFIDGFRERISYFYRRSGKTTSKEVIFFIAETKAVAVKLSFEHHGYEWLPYEEGMKRLTYKNAKDVLRKAEKFLSHL